MDQKQIEKLMKAMEESRIKRLVLKQDGFEIEIEREYFEESRSLPPSIFSTLSSPTSQIQPAEENRIKAQETSSYKPEKESKPGHYVTSPMVGTFYAAPSPDDPPFVKVGDLIQEDSVVCIIEAMKVMNEVKAGVKGTVTEILMKNGDPLEFGTRIIRINPA